MKKIWFLLVLLGLGYVFYLSIYKLPYFSDEGTFSYTYVFFNPISTNEDKLLTLVDKLKTLSEDKSEFDENILIDNVFIKNKTATISLKGKNLYSSSYNEIRIIRHLAETVRVNFKDIEYLKIKEDNRSIFQHIDINKKFEIKGAANLGNLK